MMNTKYLVCFSVMISFGVFLSATASSAAETSKVEFCVNWYNNFNEITTATNEEIPGVVWAVRKKNSIFPLNIAEGLTNEDSCTGPVTLETNEEYSFILFHIIRSLNSFREVRILKKDASAWDDQAHVLVMDFTPTIPQSGTDDAPSHTVYINTPNDTFSRLMPAMNTMLQKANELMWSPLISVSLSLGRANKCSGSNGYAGLTDITSNGLFKRIQVCLDDTLGSRTILAHEVGHGIADSLGWKGHKNYSADKADFADPYTELCQFKSGGSHALHSREWVGSASGEAFAHFIAAIAFNNTEPGSLTNDFAYYKAESYDPANPRENLPKNGVISLAPTTNSNTGEPEWPGWVDTYCKPPSKYKHLGSEGDWLYFFWGLWTGADSVRFTVADIAHAWGMTPDPKSEMDVYCVPRMTPEFDKSFNWTCKENNWLYIKWVTEEIPGRAKAIEIFEAMGFDTSKLGLELTRAVPAEILAPSSSSRGRSYDSVAETVEQNYSESRFQFFDNISRYTKIVY